MAEQAALDAARVRDASLVGERARRRRDGIVHTPPELARFCARAADELLVRELGIRRGFADAAVHVIDPACGPGAFLAAALRVARDAKVTGLDCDAVALGLARGALSDEVDAHISLRCIDTLREDSLPSALAGVAPTLVVLGNPPWTVGAATASARMQQMLADFRLDMHGEPLQERKLGVLADLYVRFFRWAIEVACAAASGAVIALVTNDSFLDGPVHRGMRALLLRTFDAVQIISLGGNALLGRAKGTGVRDHNVFGVRPGVAITLLVRKPGTRDHGVATVRYTRIFGTASQKLAVLADAALGDLDADLVVPPAPHYRFVPGRVPSAAYAGFVSLAECMPFHREGVQSNRDALAVATSREALLQRLREFSSGAPRAEERLAHYDPVLARARVAETLAVDPDGHRNLSVRRLAYRPFDDRWFCPVTPLCHRPRPDLLAAFDHAQLALVAVRKDRGSAPYTHFGASIWPIDNCFLSTRSSCRARAFPARTPKGEDNLAPAVREILARLAGAPVDAALFIRYALCVLASPTYRTRYEDELRIDYPRLPMPSTREQFEACVQAGSELLDALTQYQHTDARPHAEQAPPDMSQCDRAVKSLSASGF